MTSQMLVNDSEKAGQLATCKELFGDHNRYAVAAVHTRADAVTWIVWDADYMSSGTPVIIRQGATKELVLQGLEDEYNSGRHAIRTSRNYRVEGV